jgi:hypothetical protein
VEDELEIRDVFFGEGGTGKSYVVLCHSDASRLPISSVFQDAFGIVGPSVADFRLLDCQHVLQPSGKTVAERFALDLKQRPTIFISGATGEPKQIPSKHLKTGKMLAKLLKGQLEPHAAKIETTQDLRVKCLDKDLCALLLKGTTKAPNYLKDAMKNLLKEFPKVSFASIDSSVFYVKNLEEFLPELAKEQPRFVVFKKVSGSLSKDGTRLITSIAALPTNGVSYGSMSNLLASVITNKTEMDKIPVLPTIKLRTKKLEQEEQAKRDRKNKSADDTSSSSSSSSSDGSRDNDGSAEGRRAERERRRAEHNKAHKVRERTPEEIAEMERQRRIRMEEEAAKWNIAPDDMPDAGDTVGGEDIDDESDNLLDETDGADHSDRDGSTRTAVSDADEDDGDDVMDLD